MKKINLKKKHKNPNPKLKLERKLWRKFFQECFTSKIIYNQIWHGLTKKQQFHVFYLIEIFTIANTRLIPNVYIHIYICACYPHSKIKQTSCM